MSDKHIPKSNPKSFGITKTNRNAPQGVADPEARFDEEMQAILHEWARTNAKYNWLSSGGPLAPVGADAVIVETNTRTNSVHQESLSANEI
ncbi:hypothetical protein HOY82DRAFT_622499, partial [Tuber indicum]